MFEPVAPGVARLGIVFVNVFALGEPGEPWLLVDAGLKGSAGYIRGAVEDRFGKGSRPEAMLLTHGHFDHVGSAWELASEWDVPLYTHRLEVPYLAGRSDYPPRDPTTGGAMAHMSRLMPDHGYDFGDRVRALPPDGGVPGLPGWRWLHTPGHTPGHRALLVRLKGSGPILLSGDAVHFAENWSSRGVPGFNTSRAESLASMDRLSRIARQLKARLIIQHEPADVAKLPLFPKAAH